VNTVIQGSAADLIKLAMLRVHRRLRDGNCQTRMLLQIHDELIFESPPEEWEEVGSWITEEMMAAAPLSVPLKVDMKSGPHWGACD
jgi:DNA polymerase I